jgi:hypothetical protein
MMDDWEWYVQEQNKISVPPSQIKQPSAWAEKERAINETFPGNPYFTKQNGSSALSRLMSASVNGRIEELEERLAQERDVIPGMITTGTVTLVYAPSGAGKTVWILGNLFQSIRNNLIRGSDVIYFNEDDGAKGVLQKAKMGKRHGMNMITLANSVDP